MQTRHTLSSRLRGVRQGRSGQFLWIDQHRLVARAGSEPRLLRPRRRAGASARGQNPRVTFEEARAQFPVLERLAYLQAGSAGPSHVRRSTRCRPRRSATSLEGRSGAEYIDRILALRAELRARLAELVGVEAEQVALTGSTTDGCNIVLAGLDLGPDDEVVTTTDEHFGLLGPLHTSGARVVVAPPDPDAIVAAVTPRTRLLALSQALWTTGQVLPVHELRERTGLPILVDGGAVGRGDPGRSGAASTSSPSRVRSGSAARSRRARSSSPIPSGSASRGRATSRSSATSLTASFVPWPGARRFDPLGAARVSCPGCSRRSTARPEWGFERAR